ncbi:GNAT family acetyltransferase [Pelagibius sp. Alg239-R121]|uniref:GNAT family acetyltransferase n=1 Tax=Pelagibius sp. Alg239-R121 TaxID=2993448 RepID=UPI0024A68339|nr:GNAT family acetyltransferase [Pelagibius sp. Alg239-R121]
MEIVVYSDQYFSGVKTLWQEAFPGDSPWNAADFAVPAKVKAQPDLFLLAVEGATVAGSVMAGYDGHRGWLYAVSVLERHRGSGIGSMLIKEAEKRLEALGCVKINLQVRSTNAAVIAFYQGLGYDVEERVSMGKRVGRFDG